MSLSQEILKRVTESYRRLRNTVRFLLGNLAGFDPARDGLPVQELVELDRWAIGRTRLLHEEVAAAYQGFAFHVIYQKVHNFCVVDLGGLYLDILKDRLYTTPAGSRARRSAQTALWHIAESVVRWLAPILSFTAEEMWRYLPALSSAPRPDSVFLSTWHTLPEVPAAAIDWDLLIALRGDVARELERLRVAGAIGAPLDAVLELWCAPAQQARLALLGEELRFFMITSEAQVHGVSPEQAVRLSDEIASSPAGVPADAVPALSVPEGGIWLRVRASGQAKCVRCWHHRADVGAHAGHPELCGRCVTNLSLPGEVRRFS